MTQNQSFLMTQKPMGKVPEESERDTSTCGRNGVKVPWESFADTRHV